MCVHFVVGACWRASETRFLGIVLPSRDEFTPRSVVWRFGGSCHYFLAAERKKEGRLINE